MAAPRRRKLMKAGFDSRVETGSNISCMIVPVAMGVSLPLGGVSEVTSVSATDVA